MAALEKMPGHPRLYRRGTTYYHRAAIPKNIADSYASGQLQTWAEKAGIGLIYIQPGKPQQNAYVERYNRTVRTEWLGRYHFESIEEVQEVLSEGFRLRRAGQPRSVET